MIWYHDGDQIFSRKVPKMMFHWLFPKALSSSLLHLKLEWAIRKAEVEYGVPYSLQSIPVSIDFFPAIDLRKQPV